MKKQEIRKLFIEKRKQLTPVEYADMNRDLLRQFTQINLEGVNQLHIFLPIHERKEPDTFLLIDWLKDNHPHIKRVYPKANFADSSMQHYLDDDLLQIINNNLGIPEPVSGTKVDPADIDLVLIPMLAFDRLGYRVGYGKGFYDRFMAQCKPATQFIGLSLFEPVELIEDVDQYDVKIHRCVTTQRIWEF